MTGHALTDSRRRARRWLLAAWAFLIGLLLTWWLSALRWPPDALSVASGLMILPLVLVLPGIARGSRFACAFSTFLLTPYIGWGITEVVANPSARLFAGTSVVAALACFISLIFWLRVLRAA